MKSPITKLTRFLIRRKNRTSPQGGLEEKERVLREERKPYTLPLLTAGFYTVGVDFPAGKAALTAVKGNGAFSYQGETVRLGVEEPDFYRKALESVTLLPGTRFLVYGTLILKAYFSAPFEIPSGRPERTESLSLESGCYRCGDDLAPGDYTIRVLSGHGHIEMQGAASPWDCYLGDHDKKRIWYVPEVKHVPLKEGVLNISPALKVLLLKEAEQEHAT